MSTRKNWTEKEDEALRHLIEEERLTKWVEIAHIMTDRFGFPCNEKQCRGRYLHKLAKTVNSSPLTPEEEKSLFDMQEEIGNRWAIIANKLARTDNFVKNWFYAKLRRCMRKINKIIAKFASNHYHKVQTAVLYKIIQTVQHNPHCKKIRDKLRIFEDEHYESKNLDERIGFARQVAEDIAIFDCRIRKRTQFQCGQLKDQMEEKGEDELFDSESYHSSNPSSPNPSSHHNTINSYNTSSRSNSHSNSHSNSSVSSYSPSPKVTKNNNLLPKPISIKRSHSIDSDSDCTFEKAQSLFRSSNLDNRTKKKPEREKMELESQQYTTPAGNMDMFDEIIKIRFISPRVSSKSSSRHSSDRIEIEQPMMDLPMREQNLWQMINQREMQDL